MKQISPMDPLRIQNDGAPIKATNFWRSPVELAGKYYCSVNAGAVRLLAPRTASGFLKEVHSARYVILSIGPWPAANVPVGAELLFEDDSDTPYAYALWLDAAVSFDQVPAQPEQGREWVLSVWTVEDDRPHRGNRVPCKWRRSRSLPDQSPWEPTD